MGNSVEAKGTDDNPEAAVFSYRRLDDGRVVIAWYGKAVTTLAGTAAARFLARVEGADPAAAQLVMAKVTGNFKRGNDRRPTRP